MFNFLRTCHTVSHSGYAIYIPIGSAQWFQFLHVLAATCYFLFFYGSHLNGYDMIPDYFVLCAWHYVWEIICRKYLYFRIMLSTSIKFYLFLSSAWELQQQTMTLMYFQSWRFSESPKDSKSGCRHARVDVLLVYPYLSRSEFVVCDRGRKLI